MTEQENKFNDWDRRSFPDLQPDTCAKYLRDVYLPRKNERRKAFIAACQQAAEMIFAEFDKHPTIGSGADARKEIRIADYEAARQAFCSVSPVDGLAKMKG
jgi:hypothetical protein